MTSFDILVIAVVALSTIFAVIRGALREIGTLVALAAAAAAALFLMKPLQTLFGVDDSLTSTLLIAGVLGVLGFVLFYCLLHLGLKQIALSPSAVRTDRIAGGAFGLARGLVLIGLGFLAYAYYLSEDRHPPSVANAATLPVAKAMAGFFEGFAPQATRLTPGGAPETETETETEEESATNAAVEGYGRTERSALAEIVTTVTTREESADAGADPAGSDTDRQPSDDPIAAILKESDPQ